MSLTIKNIKSKSIVPNEDVCKNLTSEIASLKTVNNDMFYELQKAKESIKFFEVENQALKSKNAIEVREFEEKVQSAEQKLVALQTEVQFVKSQLETSKKENIYLKAKCQELQLGIDQSQTDTNVSDKENSGNYEVDQILDHKMKRKSRFFLVRWAGYDPSHDSWVVEDNLCCPNILERYKKMRNID